MKPLFLTTLLVWAACSHAVEVQLAGEGIQPIRIQLADGARLAQLVTQLPGTIMGEVYWPASRISMPALDAQMQQEQADLVAALQQMMLSAESQHQPELAYNSRMVLQLLSSLTVAGRLDAQLDPDWVRIRSELNPPLAGNYRLWLARRHPVVELYGLVSGADEVPLRPGQGVDAYLNSREFFSGADREWVYLCQPNGQVQRVPVAYWNRLHREPMPGAALFVGFAEDALPTNLADLNRRIATLIAARIAS